MIDETRSPASAECERKNAKLLRDNPKVREIIEVLARIEAKGLDMVARATIGENLIKTLREKLPTDVQREYMSHTDARTLLTTVKSEVDAAAQAIAEIR